MAGARPVVYWDTCIILAWVQNENRPAGDLEGIRYYVNQIDNNEIVMISSAIHRTEILDSKITDDAKDKLEQLFKRRNVKSVQLDNRISNLSSEIRDYYRRQRETDGKPNLSTPDAIHLATAIQYSADEFHTFDEEDSRGSRGLLPLNGNVAGYPLKVLKPIALQQDFDFEE